MLDEGMILYQSDVLAYVACERARHRYNNDPTAETLAALHVAEEQSRLANLAYRRYVAGQHGASVAGDEEADDADL